jgi:hypothetical protein
MPSTTIHIPDDILTKIDRTAKRKKISRNRFVLEACKEALRQDAGEWPVDFFRQSFSHEEKTLLHEAVTEMEQALYQNRRNRGTPLL